MHDRVVSAMSFASLVPAFGKSPVMKPAGRFRRFHRRD